MAFRIAVWTPTFEGSISLQYAGVHIVSHGATDRAAQGGSACVCWVTELPAVLALSGSRESLSNSDPLEANINVFWESTALEGQAC